MDREAQWATVHGVTKELDTTKHTCTQIRLTKYLEIFYVFLLITRSILPYLLFT